MIGQKVEDFFRGGGSSLKLGAQKSYRGEGAGWAFAHPVFREQNRNSLTFNLQSIKMKICRVVHCGLRGYEVFRIKMSLLAHKSLDFSTKRVIFSKLPKKFSTSLINGTMCKMAAQSH